jgi:hypothetical protein
MSISSGNANTINGLDTDIIKRLRHKTAKKMRIDSDRWAANTSQCQSKNDKKKHYRGYHNLF